MLKSDISTCIFSDIVLGDVHQNKLNCFLYHIQVVGILVILKDDMIFLSPFLGVIRVSKPTVIFELI